MGGEGVLQKILPSVRFHKSRQFWTTPQCDFLPPRHGAPLSGAYRVRFTSLRWRRCRVDAGTRTHPRDERVSGLRRWDVEGENVGRVVVEALHHLATLDVPQTTRAISPARQDLRHNAKQTGQTR